MKMGREREVLRWDAYESLLRARLTAAEREHAALEVSTSGRDQQRLRELEREVIEVRRLLDRLGPSPRAKMG
jgi:uncharacterized protein YceH (UPF0502 family)